MKLLIQQLLQNSLLSLPEINENQINVDELTIHVERTKDSRHGDFASNIAMVLASKLKMSPRDVAAKVCQNLPANEQIEKTDIAGPGFINFYLTRQAYYSLIGEIHQKGKEYGKQNIGQGKSVLLEYVSANPTGPLHVGHGRGAAFGDTLGRILRACGYQTHCEYYVNDAGRQMDILAVSVWLRYLQSQNLTLTFPEGAYQGAYVEDMAAELSQQHEAKLVKDIAILFDALPEDTDAKLDELVIRVKALLKDDYATVFDFACSHLVNDIRDDLSEFGVHFDEWFSERSLVNAGDIEKAIERLQDAGHLYEEEGALWFRSTDFGDDKDRVVRRANGAITYFASDLAYHFNKGERKFDQYIDIFGADHHGYVARIRAAFEALGHEASALNVLLVQFAILYRGEEKVSMSTRGGEFVTLRQLREEIGNDAARFFYVLRKPEQHMDFDLELAKRQTKDNPVYYIQYAHARICRVFRKVQESGFDTPLQQQPDYTLLIEESEMELIRMLSRYPEMLEAAAADHAPHTVAYYLRDLANAFHTYYNAHPFLSNENALRLARLGLVEATRVVIANGLDLLGVNAPEEM